MTIGIVMPCYDRELQLKKTLLSISLSKYTDYHIVIVDDGSPVPLDPSDFPIATVLSILPSDKAWINPVVPINMGIARLLDNHSPDIIILQNAECAHIGDVISYAADYTADKTYLSFGCISMERPSLPSDDEIREDISQGTISGKGMRWYNHPLFAPAAFGWCVAMTTTTIKKLNGYDEQFKDVMGGADKDLIARAKLFGCGIEITTDPFVVHQYHSRHYRRGFPTHRSLSPKVEPTTHRAVHLVTKDFV